jgi:competence protein ComEA
LFVAGVFGSATAWGQPAPAPAATPPPAVKVMTAVKPAGKININTADEAALTSLKGIGKTKAKAIIDYRQQNGPFKTVDDLTKVKGIGDKTLAALRAQLTTE